VKTRKIGIFECYDCEGRGGWYECNPFDEEPIIDDTPPGLFGWVECYGCNGRIWSVCEVLPERDKHGRQYLRDIPEACHPPKRMQ
jgi:hypothetical protein